MNNNASKPEGMNAILKSLSQTGNNNPMNNITSYLSAPDSVPGSGMLSSILGSNLQRVQEAISKSNGLPTGIVGKIFTIALPLLIGSLSKNLTKNTGQEGLSKLLGE